MVKIPAQEKDKSLDPHTQLNYKLKMLAVAFWLAVVSADVVLAPHKHYIVLPC